MQEDRAPLKADEVIGKLRSFLDNRREVYGLKSLGCFVSVARGVATENSDIDVVYQTVPTARMTLFDLAMLHDELVALLGCPVDLIQIRETMPVRLRERLQKEAIYV